MHRQMIRWVFAVGLVGCASSPGSPTDRVNKEPLSADACHAQGGIVVGDIGDGATHRSDYVCSSGQQPLGDIMLPEDGPVPVEGSVCCPP